MTKDLAIIFLGVLIALVPFLGFPNSWDTVILVVSGLLIVGLMFLLRHDLVSHITRMETNRPSREGNAFVENTIKKAEPTPPAPKPISKPTPKPTPPPTPKARRVVVNHQSDHDDEKDKEQTT